MPKKSKEKLKWEHAEKLANLYEQRSNLEVAFIKLNGAIEVLESIKPKE
ncbi:MAG: hypothetical protein Unbinned1966contig1000_15 [Prokaryotic dsDNA virus sp.]|nr:MAG: hypothetical protein Unbinned1966contig1000_15 [Prokaryotic dsDNA virus sp.]|tara:strand:- start:17647 stop:17793 length:147 start_codon:yes stop_codon:yes gene_type:complete